MSHAYAEPSLPAESTFGFSPLPVSIPKAQVRSRASCAPESPSFALFGLDPFLVTLKRNVAQQSFKMKCFPIEPENNHILPLTLEGSN
jgi:hypothetical protein